MGSRQYQLNSGAMPTTAAVPNITTTTAIKTIMQIASSSTTPLEIVEWGFSADGTVAATGKVELIDTVAIPATSLTAYAAADIVKCNQAAAAVASTIQLGTGLSGFNTSGGAEGSIVATRLLQMVNISPTQPWYEQFPLEMGYEVLVSEFVRIRTTFAAAVNCFAYIAWKE